MAVLHVQQEDLQGTALILRRIWQMHTIHRKGQDVALFAYLLSVSLAASLSLSDRPEYMVCTTH